MAGTAARQNSAAGSKAIRFDETNAWREDLSRADGALRRRVEDLRRSAKRSTICRSEPVFGFFLLYFTIRYRLRHACERGTVLAPSRGVDPVKLVVRFTRGRWGLSSYMRAAALPFARALSVVALPSIERTRRVLLVVVVFDLTRVTQSSPIPVRR
jgi:hypothetical protein